MEEHLYESFGALSYGEDHRLVLDIDQDLAAYYRSLIPKSVRYKIPRYPAHVTVVRGGKETPPNMSSWGKYESEIISFQYSPIIHFGGVFVWLNVLCPRLEEIRKELELPPRSLYTNPPEGYDMYFHTTIGNMKWRNEI